MIPLASIAFDIDGVVADTMGLFIQIAREQFHIHIQYEDITDYDLTKCLDIEFEMVWHVIEQILSGNHNKYLNPINGAPKVLKKLSQRSECLLFVTARPDANAIERWFIETLNLPESRYKIIATGNFEQKASILTEHHIKYFVEDRMETCRLLSKKGFVPIVFCRPWNRESHSFIEVNSWDEIDALIMDSE
ncbi:MAG: HAD hydrolase-like protein [Candidatus Magnetomorum sp.]|nr:HAD hydrolase-like protein [Candidatus Magnetomorum sp.]